MIARVIDQGTEFGARVARHLREDLVVWMTTVSGAGSPLPSPVWFLWDGDAEAVVYSMPGARIRNIEANPRVTLNFDGNGQGGDIVVLSGRAAVDQSLPPAAENAPYVAKYAERLSRMQTTPELFADKYSVRVRVSLTGVRGH